jgi:hypothetical protein
LEDGRVANTTGSEERIWADGREEVRRSTGEDLERDACRWRLPLVERVRGIAEVELRITGAGLAGGKRKVEVTGAVSMWRFLLRERDRTPSGTVLQTDSRADYVEAGFKT